MLALCWGCSDGDPASDGATLGDSGGTEQSAEDDGVTSGGEADSAGTTGDAEGGVEDTSSGGEDTSSDSSGGGEDTSSGGEDTSSGSEDTGAESGETGPPVCEELGTEEDCLECGDACSVGGVCQPEGCTVSVTLGFPDAFEDNIGGPLPDLIWGFSIEVEASSYATTLGFVGLPAASAGGDADAHIALYSDQAGLPDELIVAMDLVENMPAGVATDFAQVLAAPVALEPGTYWLMGKAIAPTSPFASDLQTNGQGIPVFPMALTVGDATAPFPATLQDVVIANNHAPNFYLELLQLEQ
ncbi:MAG: hypothetical protein JKY37_14325 [Nannocystaceae bacterium]|nr:hypothetical protein [Nannocystaceae bacterium]